MRIACHQNVCNIEVALWQDIILVTLLMTSSCVAMTSPWKCQSFPGLKLFCTLHKSKKKRRTSIIATTSSSTALSGLHNAASQILDFSTSLILTRKNALENTGVVRDNLSGVPSIFGAITIVTTRGGTENIWSIKEKHTMMKKDHVRR